MFGEDCGSGEVGSSIIARRGDVCDRWAWLGGSVVIVGGLDDAEFDARKKAGFVGERG